MPPSRLLRWSVALSVAALSFAARPVGSQSAPPPNPSAPAADSSSDVGASPDSAALAGVVTDTAGRGVAFAQVFSLDGQAYTVADDSGRFVLRWLAAVPTEFGVRRIGYEPIAFSVELLAKSRVHVHVRLIPIVARLSEVTVTASRPTGLVGAGFYRRRDNNFGGTFLDPDELRPWRNANISMVAFLAPGVWREKAGRAYGFNVYGRDRAGRPCPLTLYVDGVRSAVPPDEYVHPGEALAVEIYSRANQVPSEFQNLDNYCGVIVVWTRAMRGAEPPPTRRRKAPVQKSPDGG